MGRSYRFVAALMAVTFMAMTLAVPLTARASEEGKRNTTLGLGAATAYLFTRGGSKVPAFIGLGATGYAYSRYQKSINDRHRRERAEAYYYHRHHHRRRRHYSH